MILFPYLSRKGDVALDVQGVLRCSEGGNLVFKKWDRVKEMLPYIKYLKTDAAEAEILTGETDREKAGRILNKMGAAEVMITHNEEVIICTGEELIKAPFNPPTYPAEREGGIRLLPPTWQNG